MRTPPWYSQSPPRYRCQGCGSCCTGRPDDYVAISPEEIDAAVALTGLTRAWFARRYLVRLWGRQRGIRLGADGRCPFLSSIGRCRIYLARPRQCRTYPFWPEVVRTPRTWEEEAPRCPGIGRGRPVSPRRIQASVDLEKGGP